jgi:hypothetical protein
LDYLEKRQVENLSYLSLSYHIHQMPVRESLKRDYGTYGNNL